MTNEIERKKLIFLLFEAFGKGSDKARINIYVEVTEVMTLDQLKASVMGILRTHSVKDYFPLPADLLAPLNKAIADKKESVWADFKERFRHQYGRAVLGCVMDDDVYTVKKRIGNQRFEDISKTEMDWVMIKEVRPEWESIIEFPQNLLKNPVKQVQYFENRQDPKRIDNA